MFQTVFKRYEKKYLLNEKQYNSIIVSPAEKTAAKSPLIWDKFKGL